MLRFAKGHTRYVILTDNYAIKIAKVRLFYPFGIGLGLLFSRTRAKSGRAWKRESDLSLVHILLEGFFAGFYANAAEFRRYEQCPDAGLVPTLSYYFGLVCVQRRGRSLGQTDISTHPLIRSTSEETFAGKNLRRRDQYCLVDGEVLLADYGAPELEWVFREWRLKQQK